jgi:hypothetical protein
MLSQVCSLEIASKVLKAWSKECNSNKFFWRTASKLQSSTEELQANYRRLRKLAWTTQNYAGGTLNYSDYGHYRDYTNYVAGPGFADDFILQRFDSVSWSLYEKDGSGTRRI